MSIEDKRAIPAAELRDEIAQLQTALTIRNGTIEQLKARNKQLEDRNAMLTARAEEQQPPALQMPEGWEEKIFDAMLEGFAIGRLREGGLPVDDTQVGVEFACKQITAMLAAAPKAEPLNQCDGCRAGVPLTNGMHRMGKPDGYPDPMVCTAHLYKAEQFCDGHCTWLDHHPDCEIGEAVGAIYSSISGTCERLVGARREAGYSMGATEDDLLRMASGFRRHAEQQGGDS